MVHYVWFELNERIDYLHNTNQKYSERTSLLIVLNEHYELYKWYRNIAICHVFTKYGFIWSTFIFRTN